MADEADVAAEAQEFAHTQQLAAARSKAASREVQPTGRCHFCDDDFDEPPAELQRLYCDDFCRDKHARQRQVNGWANYGENT